jgi:hypothetical protein
VFLVALVSYITKKTIKNNYSLSPEDQLIGSAILFYKFASEIFYMLDEANIEETRRKLFEYTG